MRVCLIGGIFDKPAAYRQRHRYTPETILLEQLLDTGIDVEAAGHSDRIDPAGYDIIHVHHLGRGILRPAIRKGGSKLVFTPHDGPLLCGIERSARRRLALRFALRRADAIIALSQFERLFLAALARHEESVTVIPNGVPMDVYHPAVAPEGAGSDRLLFVGQLLELKGVDTLLRALAKVAMDRAVQLRFVYQHPGHEHGQRRLARELGVESLVEFAGAMDPVELADEYRNADVLVLPSRAECLPSVVTEALLCGTPVVASNVGGIPEQVGPCGRLVPPGEPDSLAEAIISCLEQRESLRGILRVELPRLRERYDPRRMAEAHLELYRRLLD